MEREYIIKELTETAIWLLSIAGLLLLVVGGIAYHHIWAAYSGGTLCTIYFSICAWRNRTDRRKALVNVLIAVALAATLLAHYLIQSL